MTYRESYLKCKTLSELLEKVRQDYSTAIIIGNLDRYKVILEEATKVANEKFNDKSKSIEELLKEKEV